MKSKNKSRAIIGFIFLVLLVNILAKQVEIESNEVLFHENLVEVKRIKTSGFWDLTGSPIYIDDSNPNFNWSKTAADNDWCSGSGTFSDPYVIENVTIDAQNTLNGIEIRNSYVNFVLRNNTLFNGQPGGYAGIYLLNVINGTIEFVNSSFNNGDGIILENCNNTLIQDSIFNNNGDGWGIDAGWFHPGGSNLTIRRCIIKNNIVGLCVTGDYNEIYENVIDNSGGMPVSYGVNVAGNFNNVYSNNISRTLGNARGISMSGDNNTVWLNNVSLSGNGNARDYGGSTKWDNGTIGNYWDDYGGVDRNDDLIGDTPYVIELAPLKQDNYPIWDDDPDVQISINSPTLNDQFGKISPKFDINITTVGVFNQSWYTLGGSPAKYFFTGNTGTIDQTGWNLQPNGSVLIRFKANDSETYDGYEEIIVRKSLYPVIYINSIDTQTENYLVGKEPPAFNIFVLESELDTMWYSLNDGITNTTFTSNTTINQQLWNGLSNGTVTLIFYANDTSGREGRVQCTILIDIMKPIIVINLPEVDKRFGVNAPEYDLTITEANLDTIWYNLGGGENHTIEYLSGDISQVAWESVAEGSVLLTFYANDTLGNTRIISVPISKEISVPPINWPLLIAILIGAVSIIVVAGLITIKRVQKIKIRDISEKELLMIDKKILEVLHEELDVLINKGTAHYNDKALSKAKNYWEDALRTLEHITTKAGKIEPKTLSNLQNRRINIMTKIDRVKVKEFNNYAKNYEELAEKFQQNQDYNNAIDAYNDAQDFFNNAEEKAIKSNMAEMIEVLAFSKLNVKEKISNLELLREQQTSRPAEGVIKEFQDLKRFIRNEQEITRKSIDTTAREAKILSTISHSISPKDLKRMIKKIIKNPDVLIGDKQDWINVIQENLTYHEFMQPPKWQKFVEEIAKLVLPKIGKTIVPAALDFVVDWLNDRNM